jgi:predicted chitinase
MSNDIDILNNQATNSANPQIGNKMGSEEESPGWVSQLGSYLSGIPAAIGGAGKGIGKYVWDTVAAEKNNVPYGVRAAVAGARKSEDKLNTLKQYYPDAMSTPDGDFTFIDPKTQKRITLNDPGWSVGDAIESIPEMSEATGATIGSIGGGIAGTTVAPGAGTIVGGIGGAGIGGAAGNELGRSVAKMLASILSDKGSIDTRTFGDYAKDAGTTAALNSGFAALPFGGRYLKNRNSAKLLTPDSAEQYQYLAEKGYEPTLGQIGSEAGKELSEKRIAGGMIGKELHNQGVLQKNIDEFVPEGVGLDENALANQFRAGQKANVGGKKAKGTELYKEVTFGDDIPPSNDSKAFIEDLYQKRGGSANNPDLVLDSSMERKMKRIMAGESSEKELESFRSDVKTALRNRDLKYDTKETLLGLDKTLTDDLVKGSPELTDADRAARAAWFEYKDTQKKVKDLIGRSEGVTDKTAIGQGLTEAESLDNAKGIFSSGKSGSDAEAQALSGILSEPEKRTILASLMKEGNPIRGAQNPLENIQQKYNAERIGQFLTRPEDKAAYDDLLRQAQGTKFLPEGSIDKTGHIYGEAAVTTGAGLVNPYLGLHAAGIGNILRGAPGTSGGSGQFGRSLVTQSAFPQIGRQAREGLALRAARQGEVPGNLNPMPRSDLSIPATMVAGQMAAGNVADAPESNLRIPDSVINQNIPQGSPALSDLPQFSLDDLLKPQGQSTSLSPQQQSVSDLPQISLDDLLSPSQPMPGQKIPVREMQPSVVMQSTNELGQKLPVREMQAQPKIEDLDAFIAKTYGGNDSSSYPKQATMEDLDKYINETYAPKKTGSTRDYSYKNQAAQDYMASKKQAGRDVFKETLQRNMDLLENSGIKGDRLNHFVAQLAHESGGFNHLNEIDPSKSNLSDKGGETYKGRGWIQLTGDKNYKRYGDKLGIDLVNNPDLAADPDNALKIAVAYWNDHNLNDLADQDDIKGITRAINGGLNGFQDRKSWLNKVRSVGLEL